MLIPIIVLTGLLIVSAVIATNIVINSHEKKRKAGEERERYKREARDGAEKENLKRIEAEKQAKEQAELEVKEKAEREAEETRKAAKATKPIRIGAEMQRNGSKQKRPPRDRGGWIGAGAPPVAAPGIIGQVASRLLEPLIHAEAESAKHFWTR